MCYECQNNRPEVLLLDSAYEKTHFLHFSNSCDCRAYFSIVVNYTTVY